MKISKKINRIVPPFYKKLGLYFIGTFSTRLLTVVLVPIYAYFVAATDLGEYDYILAIANIVYPIAYFVIWESILKYGMQDRNNTDKTISNALSLYIIVSIIMMSIAGISLFFSNKNLFLICIMSIFLGGASVWQFSARTLQETKQFVLSGILSSVIVIVIDCVLAIFHRLNYKGLCLATILSQLTVMATIELKIHNIKRIKKELFDFELLKKLLLFCGPLVINNIALYLYNSGSKIIIRQYLGSYANGQYSFASKFSLLINIFSSVVSMAVIEEAYSFPTLEEYRNKVGLIIDKISKAYFYLIAIALPAIYLLYNIAFQNTEYMESVDYIFILLFGALFGALSNNFGSAFQVTEKTKYIAFTTILGSAVSIIFSLATVRRFGVYGVLIGGSIGPFAMMLSRAIFARKATGLNVSWTSNILPISICILEYIVLRNFKDVLIQCVLLAVVVFIAFLSYKDSVKSMIHGLKNGLED